MVGLPGLSFCHCNLEMQEYERFSPRGTLIAAVFLHRLSLDDTRHCKCLCISTSLKGLYSVLASPPHLVRLYKQILLVNSWGKYVCEREQEWAFWVEGNEVVRSLSPQIKISSWFWHILDPACFLLGVLSPFIIMISVISTTRVLEKVKLLEIQGKILLKNGFTV